MDDYLKQLQNPSVIPLMKKFTKGLFGWFANILSSSDEF